MNKTEKKFLKSVERAGRRAAFKRAHPRIWAAWFFVRTLPVFIRECVRMGLARMRKRAYVAPRDMVQVSGVRGQGSVGMCYRPDSRRFGAVVQFPKSRTGYIVGKGGNLVSPKRQRKKGRKWTKDRCQGTGVRDQGSGVRGQGTGIRGKQS